MGQCVSYFTKKTSKVSPQIDEDNADFSSPVGLHSPDRKPSEDGSSSSEYSSSLISELDGDSFSSSDSSLFASTHWVVPSRAQEIFGEPSRRICPGEAQDTTDKPVVTRENRPATSRTCAVPFRPQSDSNGGTSNGSSLNQEDKGRRSNNSTCKSFISEDDGSWDDILSQIGSSFTEGRSDAGYDSSTSAGVTRNSLLSGRFGSPLFIEDLEDMDTDESLEESKSEVEVELAPERERAPDQLAVVGVPCGLHTKGKSPEISLSGIFSDEETEEELSTNGAQRRLGSTPRMAVKHTEGLRRVMPEVEEERSTSKTAGCDSLPDVVYNDEEIRLMAEILEEHEQ